MWTIGDVVNQHFTLSYDAYLTGSDPEYEQAMGRTSDSWLNGTSDTVFEEAASSLATNEEATILYKNYNNEYCKQTYEVPTEAWSTTEFSFTKAWAITDSHYGNQPTTVTVQLQSFTDGSTWKNVYNPQTVGTTYASDDGLYSSNGWVGTWTNLPINEDGKTLSYRVVEVDVPDAYDNGTGIADSSNSYTITNTLKETSVSVKKVWDDEDDVAGFRTDTVDITLQRKSASEEWVVVDTQTISDSYTWNNLPCYVGGLLVEYRVVEADVPSGYTPTVTPDGTTTNGYIVTNTHVPEKVEVTINKSWDDNSDYEGFRPGAITVYLYGYVGDTCVVSKSETISGSENVWSHTWKELPKHYDGQEIVYTVDEDAVANYTAGETVKNDDGSFNITNTHETTNVGITVIKAWNDASNQDGVRPPSITVTLTGSNGYSNTVTLNADNSVEGNADNWSCTWNDLPKYANGTLITYDVSETIPADYAGYYTAEKSQDGNAFTFTNTHTPATVDIPVTKVWVDDNNRDNVRPTEVTVYLFANGTLKSSASINADENGSWTYTFEGLPVYSSGEEIEYKVVESYENIDGDTIGGVEGYKSVVTGEVKEGKTDGFTVTNTREYATVSKTVTKVWDDDSNRDNIRPTTVTVQLLADGEEYGEAVTFTGTGNSWSYEWTELPKYATGKVGVEVEYAVTETSVPDTYTSTVEGLTITNTHTTEKTEVSVSKVWQDSGNRDKKRPDSVVINLMVGDTKVAEALLSATNGWKHTFTDLNKYENGVEIIYTVTENAVTNYDTEITGSQSAGYVVTNTYTAATVDIPVTKIWDDKENQDGVRPGSVTVNLLANGEQVQSVELNSDNTWSHTFTGLPKNADGVEITYTITEDTVSDYTTAITGNATDGFVVTNTHKTETTSVTVNKAWDDNDDQDGKRTESVTVQLYANGAAVEGKTAVLNSGNNWTCTFTGLDKYAAVKQEISYTVDEVDVPDGYTRTISGDAATGYTITNSYTPDVTSVTVTKKWEDNENAAKTRPEYITVTLKDGDDVVGTVKLTADNGWKYTFTGLPKYKDGAEIVYTVTETDIPGNYTSTVDGLTITNTLICHDVTVHYVDTEGNTIASDEHPYEGAPKNSEYDVPNLNNGEFKPTVIENGDDLYVFVKWDESSSAEADVLDSNKEVTYVYALYQDPDISKAVDSTIINVTADGTDTVTYTITVTNPNSFALSDVVITDAIPEGLTNVKVDGKAVTGTTITATVDVPANSTADVTVTGTITGNTKWTYANTAQIDKVEIDPDNDGTTTEITYDDPIQSNTVHTDVYLEPTIEKWIIDGENSVKNSTIAIRDENGEYTITYSMVITNPNNVEITNVTVTDAIPDGLKFVSATANGTEDDGTVTWNIASIAANGTATVQFTAQLSEAVLGAEAPYTNSANITGFDIDTPNNDPVHDDSVISSNEVVTTVTKFHDVTVRYEDTEGNEIKAPETPYTDAPKDSEYNVLDEALPKDYKPATIETANGTYVYTEIKDGSDGESGTLDSDKEITYVYALYKDPSISKAVDPTIINITADGTYTVTYTITVTNPNSFALSDVVITDAIPEGLTDVKVNDEAVTGTTITATVNVDANSTADVTVTGTIIGNTKWTYANTAQIDKVEIDPDNDGTTTEITYDDPIQSNTVHTDVYLDPTITKSVDKKLIAITSEDGVYQVVYTIIVTNPNNVAITNVAVSDVLPEGLSYVAPTAAVNGESYDEDTRTVSWVIPAIAANSGTATVQFVAQLSESKLGSEAAYINQAQIKSFTIDTPHNDPVTDTSVITSNKVVTDVYRNPTIDKYIADGESRVQSNVVYISDENGTYYIDYVLVVNNPNDFALTNVTVTDNVPTGLSFVSSQPAAVNTDGTLTWSGLEVPAAGQYTITARFRIDDANASMDIALGDTAPYKNKATVTGMTVDPDGSGSSQPDVPDIPAENVTVSIPSNEVVTNVYKDPTITKVVEGGKDRFSVGETVQYTITVTNEGSVPIYKLPVTDTLPAGMTFALNSEGQSVTLSVSSTPVEYQGQSSITVENTTINAYIACLNSGATATIKVWAKITDDSFGTYDNIATLEEAYLNYADEVPYVEDIEDNAVIDTVTEPYIEKSVDKAAAAMGETLTYTITVYNPTVEDIFDAVATDTLPMGLTCTADNYDAATRTLTWTDIDIASGASHTITFTAVVENVDDYNKYENIAYLNSVKLDEDGDGDLDEQTYTDKFDTAETKPLRDPVIIKSDDKDYVREGDVITYTITVLNPNEFDLLNVVVSDPLPDGVKLIGEDGHIAENEGGTLEWTIGRIAAAANGQPGRWSTQVQVSVTDRADAIYYNTAYIDSAVIDLDGDGNVDEATDTETGDRELEYENDPDNRTGENASETVEADVYYELTVEFREYDTTAENNHGSEIADAIGKNDYKNGDTYHVNDIQPDAIPNIIIDHETGEIWVKKEVSDRADPVTETINRADRTVVVLYEQYDSLFTLNKQVTATPTDEASWTDEITVLPGTTVYFRIAVTNLVNYPISGLELSDALVYNAYEPTLPENWSSLLSAFPGQLAANETWTSQTMELDTTGTYGGDRYINTATVADGEEATPDLTDDAKVNIIAPGKLTLTKTANVAADETTGVKYVAPGRVSFTIQVTNTGESVLKDVQIVDDSYDVILVDAQTGTETVVPMGAVIRTIETLAVGETVSLTVYIDIPEETANGQSVQNFATATGKDQNGNDVDPSTDDDTVVVTKAVKPELSIIKTVNNTDARENPLTVAPSEALVYTITITNSSSVDAEDVYVLDYMHVDGTKLTDEWAIDKSWVIDVPANSSVTIEDAVCSTIMPMAPASTVINNVVELYESEQSFTGGDEPIDEDIAKVETDALYTINVVKAADVAVLEPGDTAEYVIYVTNTGNTVLTDILVTDILDGVWGELPEETENKAEVTVTENDNNTLTIDSLQPEDCVRLTFSYDIAADVEGDTVVNTVTAEAETPDGEKVTGTDDETVTIFRNQLDIEKTALVGSAAPGSTVQFLITVTNTGDSVLNNVVVTDDLDVTVTKELSAVGDSDLVEADEPSASRLEALGIDEDDYEDTVIGFFDTLQPGEVRFIYVDYVIPEDAEDGDTVYNNAAAEADGGHKDTASDELDVIVPVVQDYRMTITKTANLEQAKAGQTVLYTITVTNIGESDLTNVVVTDSLPVSYNGTTYAAGQPIKTIALLESGKSEILTVAYTVPENSTATLLENTAEADSDETDKVTDKVTITIRQPAVTIKKTVNTQSATAGQKVYYTITVTNTGNCTLNNLKVSDTKINYSYTISELKAGESWTSPAGELYYTFGDSTTVGTTFANNASVSHEEVKGATDTTITTVTSNPNDYKGPDTGDITVSGDEEKTTVVWIVGASAAVVAAATTGIIISRKRRKDD